MEGRGGGRGGVEGGGWKGGEVGREEKGRGPKNIARLPVNINRTDKRPSRSVGERVGKRKGGWKRGYGDEC